jgi:hypothetical protein
MLETGRREPHALRFGEGTRRARSGRPSRLQVGWRRTYSAMICGGALPQETRSRRGDRNAWRGVLCGAARGDRLCGSSAEAPSRPCSRVGSAPLGGQTPHVAFCVILASSKEAFSDLSYACGLIGGLMESFLDSSGRTAGAAHPAPSRIESARMRAARARRALLWGSVAAFASAFAVTRASHPAASHGSSLSVPASLVAQIQGSGLGGGSIAAPSGSPSVATSSS